MMRAILEQNRSQGSIGGVTARVETLTAASAASLLRFKERNRNINQAAVRDYVRQIKSGQWVVNGEPIIISSEETLLDGQHRLLAIIEADRPVDILVVRGIAKDAFQTIDTGRVRNAGDVLGIEGKAYPKVHAAAARLAYTWRKHGNVPAHSPEERATITDLVLLVNEVNLAPAVAFAISLSKDMYGMIPQSEVAFLYWAFGGTEEAGDFFQKVADGTELDRRDPRYRLRERLLDPLRTHSRMNINMRLALVIKAWNTHLNGRKMDVLFWRPSNNEPFPKIQTRAGIHRPPVP